MTASFSAHLLEAMGFRDTIEEGSLSATFTSVTVFEVRGARLPNEFAESRQGRVAGADYRVALSAEINAGCQRLVGDSFVDSEADWRKETRASGPFVLVAVGPTDLVSCAAGRSMQMPDGSIHTFDSFPTVREVVTQLEDRILPPVVAALSIAFNQPGHYVALRKVDRALSGRTADGAVLHDVRLNVRIEGFVSHTVSEADATTVLSTSVEQASKLRRQAARNLALGIAEDDELKKFLFFFLALEIETQACFGRVDHPAMIRSQLLRTGTSTVTAELMERAILDLDNLFDRFVWCATCVWTHLSDDDVQSFKRLKGARDAIAHGRSSEPPSGYAREAELLAYKILGP